jgi:hypothetical protein
MVKSLDFRLLSKAAREEIFRVAGITDEDREWLRSRGKPVGVLELEDTYKVSRAQQKKAYALLQAICRWSGYTPLETEKTLTKQMFISSQLPTLADSFSLSDCSREVARLYITYLIDFCLLHDIPCGEPLYKLCEDIPKYVYMATVHKRCAVCGKKADLHHAQGGTIGMGSNRNKVNHIGRPCLPLCRHHHTSLHKIGEKEFLERYMLEPVKVDERIATSYNLHRAKEWKENEHE